MNAPTRVLPTEHRTRTAAPYWNQEPPFTSTVTPAR